ncbi:polyprenol monophosphomannose synthase [Candidatus Parcubacteria bacterium]|nr:MAG: polyprenol monophosphomannose synthase [Candidatus Parcubacteria bacterium]
MKIFIVIPTYNEINNISGILEKIFFLSIGNLNVLIVDDNSPDGTGKVVETLKSKYPNLYVLHRQKKSGLGTAYVVGFKKALEHNADIIFEMDADFSHNPHSIPDFLREIKNSDLVLGSRYIVGGKINNWKLARRLISRFGNFYARNLLRLPINDLTGGFKCYKKEVLEKINLDGLSSQGYNFQIETTYLAYQKGFKIKEIPITFTERAGGKSKFSLRIILESFYKVFLLKFRK